jgi:membrane protein YqaA with SNARE-associated domain
MRMPFWSCLFYIAVGKFARYAVICAAMLQFFPGG